MRMASVQNKCIALASKTASLGNLVKSLIRRRLSIHHGTTFAPNIMSRTRTMVPLSSHYNGRPRFVAMMISPTLLQTPAESLVWARTFTHESAGKKYEQRESSSKDLEDSALNCRLAAENGFLSWTRNGYISCVAAAALLTHAHTEAMLEAVYGMFFISYMNVVCGTTVYSWNLIMMRKRVQMGRPLMLMYLFLTMFHLVVYSAVLLTFNSELAPYKTLEEEESQV